MIDLKAINLVLVIREKIKKVAFVIILVGSAVCCFINDYKKDELNSMVLFIYGSFLLAGMYLAFTLLPRVGVINIIYEFAEKIYLKHIFFVSILFATSILLARKIMYLNGVDKGITFFIFAIFMIAVGQSIYSSFIKNNYK